jgi:hypothetical protein
MELLQLVCTFVMQIGKLPFLHVVFPISDLSWILARSRAATKVLFQYLKYFRDCILWGPLLCVVRVPIALHIETSMKLQLEFICELCSAGHPNYVTI